jgi:quercetin dioxygenase-like cupin family protein
MDIETLKFHSIGGVEIRQDFVGKGLFVVKHSHDYDHASILAGGCVDVEVDGVVTRYRGYCVINIEANKWHQVTAVEDSHWFCIHSTAKAEAHE